MTEGHGRGVTDPETGQREALPCIRAVATSDPTAIELRASASKPGVMDAAILADFALGAALRRQLGFGRQLPTVTLTVELDAPQLPGQVSVRAWAAEASGRIARAHGVFRGLGQRFGQCSATFAVSQTVTELAPLPWELGTQALPGQPEDDSAESAFASACTVTGRTSTLHPTPAMLNRSGYVQGGVLFRLAATLPDADATMVSGHLQFLSTAEASHAAVARPHVLEETRRLVFVHSVVEQDGRAVASGCFVFRKDRA